MQAVSQRPVDPMGFVDDAGIEWIPAPRAARLIPSPTGKATHLSSVRRWVAQGHLRGKRQTRFGRVYLWVALSDVLAMRELDDLPGPRMKAPRPAKGKVRRSLEKLFGKPRK